MWLILIKWWLRFDCFFLNRFMLLSGVLVFLVVGMVSGLV